MYLILHKVRGEPAFDIAEPMEVGGETWWIIPTSGHRAYPWKQWPLEAITYLSINAEMDATPLLHMEDHYNVTGEKPPPNFNIMAAISGLLPKIKRRV